MSVLAMTVALAACAAGPAEAADVPIGTELAVNGGFEKLEKGWPAGWRRFDGAAVRSRDGKTWILLSAYGATPQDIPVRPDWMKLRLRFRMRAAGVVRGDDGWKNARMAMSFHDASGTRVGPWPDVLWAEGDTPWRTYERVFLIPKGAAYLTLAPSMFGSKGTVEFDDISVTLARKRTTSKEDLPLPPGAVEPWGLAEAWRRGSATRETICLNGLWRLLPVATGQAGPPPGDGQGWGWFKVPGVWPRSLDGEAQTLHVCGYMEDRIDLGRLDQAWYERKLVVPAGWRPRRVFVEFTMLQTHARVFLDGRDVGEMWFPGGSVEVTPHVRAGRQQRLAALVTARPLEAERTVFMAPDRIITSKASIGLRGLTGDVYLVSRPRQDAVGDVRITTKLEPKTISLDAQLQDLGPGARRLRAKILDGGKVVKEFASEPFDAAAVRSGRFTFSAAWPDAKLWDTHTPQHVYDAVVTLLDGDGRVLDESLPIRFGFREFRIDGRDFLLNGKRIHLRCLHTRNINRPADQAWLPACRNTCRRMKEYGFNFLITANYHFQPGTVSYLDGLYEAADETGVLASVSLPHFRDFAGKLDRPEQARRYRRMTEWIIRRVQNHPSVVMYAMSHNATGYKGDQNPLRMDGVYDPEDPAVGGRPNRNRGQARIAAGIAKSIDPARPVYHHQSGNLGQLYTVNIYLNWAPRQERSDWLEHWATKGVKPMFFVEWGLPHISSWSSYRGPNFIWRSEEYQSVWAAEFNAAYLGDDAYRMTDAMRRSLAHEEDLWSRGKPFHWGWLNQHFNRDEDSHARIKALFADDNWRCLRTWGVSAILPWDQGNLWKQTKGFTGGMVHAPQPKRGLKRPGIVPDRLGNDEQYINCRDANTVGPTVLGRSFLRWNRPLIGFIGGRPEHFTDKGHIFTSGEEIRKQLVILNDTREAVTCRYSWTFGPEKAAGKGAAERSISLSGGKGRARVEPGGRATVPIGARLPRPAAAGAYEFAAEFDFGGGARQTDTLAVHVIPLPPRPKLRSKVALLDSKGMTASMLDRLGVAYTKVGADAELRPFGLLVIGRKAIGVDTKLPDLSAVRDGLRVLVLEQTAETLSQRVGFRVNVHGMRRVFARVPGHPALAGLGPEHLRDWRGAATLTRPHLDIQGVEADNPKWTWCGFRNTRVWRCGHRGSVAGVLIEKPPRGGFLPIVDCGFDLQYAPLLEYVEGRGRVIFCQLDLTGRTEPEPATWKVFTNLLTYLDQVKPAPKRRKTLLAGDARSACLLTSLGVRFDRYARQKLGPDELLVVGPGAANVGNLNEPVSAGLRLLCLGLDANGLNRIRPGRMGPMTTRQTPCCRMEEFHAPAVTGVSNAELHWRTKPQLTGFDVTTPRLSTALGFDCSDQRKVVYCQAAPWMFDYLKKPYLRTTYRRNVFLVSRLLHNLGAPAETKLLERLNRPGGVHEYVLPAKWTGRVDRDDVGRKEGWQRPGFDDAKWRPIAVPGTFDTQRAELKDYDGLFWYRLRFTVPDRLTRKGLALSIGAVDDESWVWLNGRLLGEVTKKTHPKDYWNVPRRYELPAGLLKHGGENVLAVRVNDTYQTGGIKGVPALRAPGVWLRSYYVQKPEAGDDPYRYYRW